MENLFLIPLVVVGIWLLWLASRAVASYVRVAFLQAQDDFNVFDENLRERSARATDDIRRRARKREFRRWFDAKMGAGGTSDSVNDEVLEAQRQAQVLRRLVTIEVPETALRCAKVHRLMARAAEAEFIREIAQEPEPRALRDRMVDLVEATVEMIGAYPFILDDDTLLQNLVVLRKRILPTCRACPYLHHAVAEAPPLCPSAEAAGVRTENVGCHDGRKQKR